VSNGLEVQKRRHEHGSAQAGATRVLGALDQFDLVSERSKKENKNIFINQ
jgi:hypothetical protein